MLQLSSDQSFHFELLRVIAQTPYQGADIAEVLDAAQKIVPGDFESWYSVFYSLAQRVQTRADNIDSTRHPVSARLAYFRASSYYRAADFYLHKNWDDPRIDEVWKLQRRAFDQAIALLPIPAQRFEVPAKGFRVPGIFYSCGQTSRPTLIVTTGFDGSQEELFHLCIDAALQRNMNVITCEGPGQPAVRREQSLGFIHDWEAVITPVVDYAVQRPEVDPKAIGLIGVSLGGYLAPRAAAFEHRLAAVIALDGVVNLSLAPRSTLPPELLSMFDSGDRASFNAGMNAMLSKPETPVGARWAIEHGMWCFKATSPFDYLVMSEPFKLAGCVDKIKAPVLVGDAEQEHFFAGQPKQLADELGSLATHYVFETADSAGAHCSIGACIHQNQVVLDWFEDVIDKI